MFAVYYPIFSSLVGDADSVCGLLSNFLLSFRDADSVCGLISNFHHSCRGC